jgi:GTP cyclohydrolase II
VAVIKAAIDPVWHLPGVAERFGVKESALRRTLFEQTGGMYPELVTRRDLHVFLPPIGGITLYIFGDPTAIHDPARKLTCRVHDECNGSDVFGSDICTCRPYLTHGIEECVREAQSGGAGLIVYNRKEGRALGEVTKFLVYNARKRQPGGDQASTYFARTECVAGVQDARFQQLMPDVLHWLGVTRIDRLVSMSNLKYDALVGAGIEIGTRVSIPPGLVPQDASVELEAKKAAGYFTQDEVKDPAAVVGRDIKDY